MWKYIDDVQCKDFLLSLCLLNCENDKEYLKKIYSISNNIEENYIIHKIKKRNGKYRTIYAPKATLKHIQRQILNNILNNKSTSKYAMAYKKGISLKQNAQVHTNKKIILKLDIKDFFENIKFIDIYNCCFSIEYFPKSIGMLLTYLCTYDDYLPQGAPTSSYISNLVMKDFDEELGSWCEGLNISYTRYSDDMTFSGDFDPKEVINKVRNLLSILGLKLNKEKIHVISNNNRQGVTGLVVNKKVQVDIKYRKKIRQEIYFIKKFGIESHIKRLKDNAQSEDYLNKLYGRILFVLQITPDNKEFIEYKEYLKNIMMKTRDNI